MRFLPRLTSGRNAWMLPLAETAAVALCDVLLEDADSNADRRDAERGDAAFCTARWGGVSAPGEGRRERFASLLREDPVLATWAFCRAATGGGLPAAQTVAEVAHQLEGHLLQWLDWSDSGWTPMSEPSVAEAAERCWAEWTARSLSLARRAAEVSSDAEVFSDDVAERAYWLGMLFELRRWLGVCQDTGLNEQAPDAASADVLAGVLDQLDDLFASQQPAAIALRRAAMELFGDAAGNGAVVSSEMDPDPATGRLVQQRLKESAALSAAADLLPRLVLQQRRLAQLSGEFAVVLEREKLAAMQQLAYGASHEVNNPLANISTRAQTLLRDERDPEKRRKLATINSQAFRAHEMISDMMLFAKPPRIECRQVRLAELLQRVVSELRDDAELQETALQLQMVPEGSAVWADPDHLAMALKAVCRNSLEALVRGGTVALSAMPEQDEQGRSVVRFLVVDDGPGIPDDVRRHLFDPFFSGREAGRGLGLGLSKCWRIVEQHGGSIDVQSSSQRGTRFLITLPAASTAAAEVETSCR